MNRRLFPEQKESAAKTLIREVHPLWIRWAHWLNFPLLSLMLVSGAMIYWANDVYTPFLPERFYAFWHLDHRLALGLGLHLAFMWFFALNGILYVAYVFLSGEWRCIVPFPRHFKQSFQVLLAELHLRPYPKQEGKFNAAQRCVYTAIIFMGALSVVTGMAIYKPVQLSWIRRLLLDYPSSRWMHFLLAVGFFLFFFVHLTQVALAGWNKFRAMVIGSEVVGTEGGESE